LMINALIIVEALGKVMHQ